MACVCVIHTHDSTANDSVVSFNFIMGNSLIFAMQISLHMHPSRASNRPP
ncbi:hypothetical protein [Moraxella lacunata]